MQSWRYNLMFSSNFVTFNYQVDILTAVSARRFHLTSVGPIVRLLCFRDRELEGLTVLVHLVVVFYCQDGVVLVPCCLALRVGLGTAGQSDVFAFFNSDGLIFTHRGRNCSE